MAIDGALKFFKDNYTRHATARSDALNYNLNAGLGKLVEELHSEIRKLHFEIATVSQQVKNLRS